MLAVQQVFAKWPLAIGRNVAAAPLEAPRSTAAGLGRHWRHKSSLENNTTFGLGWMETFGYLCVPFDAVLNNLCLISTLYCFSNKVYTFSWLIMFITCFYVCCVSHLIFFSHACFPSDLESQQSLAITWQGFKGLSLATGGWGHYPG